MADKYRGGRGWRRPASGGRLAAGGGRGARALSRGDGRASRCTRAWPRPSSIVDAANGFIAETAPWALAKDPAQRRPARRRAVRGGRGRARRGGAAAAGDAGVGAEILRRVGDADAGRRPAPRSRRRAGGTAARAQIVKGAALWPRTERPSRDAATVTTEGDTVDEQPRRRRRRPAAPAPRRPRRQPARRAGADDARIAIDDFMKVELRVGQGARGRGRAEVEEAD